MIKSKTLINEILYSFLLFFLGITFNYIAIKSNNGIMPVKDTTASYYGLTDIFPLGYNHYYFSIGDVYIALGNILFFIVIFKYVIFVPSVQRGTKSTT